MADDPFKHEIAQRLDDLRATVKLAAHHASSRSDYGLLNLGLAVCNGLLQRTLPMELAYGFIDELEALLADEPEDDFRLPDPPRVLAA